MEVRYPFLVGNVLMTPKFDNNETLGYFRIRLEHVLYATHPPRGISEPIFCKKWLREAHTTKRVALKISRRDFSVDASLGVCTPFPMSRKPAGEFAPGSVSSCVLYGACQACLWVPCALIRAVLSSSMNQPWVSVPAHKLDSRRSTGIVRLRESRLVDMLTKRVGCNG